MSRSLWLDNFVRWMKCTSHIQLWFLFHCFWECCRPRVCSCRHIIWSIFVRPDLVYWKLHYWGVFYKFHSSFGRRLNGIIPYMVSFWSRARSFRLCVVCAFVRDDRRWGMWFKSCLDVNCDCRCYTGGIHFLKFFLIVLSQQFCISSGLLFDDSVSRLLFRDVIIRIKDYLAGFRLYLWL